MNFEKNPLTMFTILVNFPSLSTRSTCNNCVLFGGFLFSDFAGPFEIRLSPSKIYVYVPEQSWRIEDASFGIYPHLEGLTRKKS